MDGAYDANPLGQQLQEPAPVPTTEKHYATLDDWMNPKLRETRYAEREFPHLGWLVARSLSDKELTNIQMWSYKAGSDKQDTVKMAQGAARLIIDVIVDPNSKKPYMTESHIRHLREVDAGLVDAVSAWCRTHVGLLSEEEAKN